MKPTPKKKDSDMKLVLEGEVFIQDGRKKYRIPNDMVLSVVLHALEEGFKALAEKEGKNK